MYHRQKIDEHLRKEFEEICAISDEIERINKFSDFFYLYLDTSRLSDHEILFISSEPTINAIIKDKKTGNIYTAAYENNSTLLKAQAEHIKFVNVNISLADGVEREKTYYRFPDPYESDPLHDEIYATFEGRYKLTLLKKYPAWYRPIESGIYITLSDTKEYYTKYHAKIQEGIDIYTGKKIPFPAFEFAVFEFIEKKEKLFNDIMARFSN